MSRDPGFKFQKFLFSPNFVLNFRKVTKFEGNWLKSKKLQARNKLGGGGVETAPPVLIGLMSAPSLRSFTESVRNY